MYLLQRKSDGKFWKNGTQYKHWDKKWLESNWTDNIQECRPFKTVAAAMRSRGTHGGWRMGVDTWDSYKKRVNNLYGVVNARVTVTVVV